VAGAASGASFLVAEEAGAEIAVESEANLSRSSMRPDPARASNASGAGCLGLRLLADHQLVALEAIDSTLLGDPD
jgi:hypothetical protein